ncbi:Peroxisomal (S)-2-hydroxy-acid oxidase GLO5 [Smittium mucronatum]|uniref:Peroxisomal (S)-2-hydroxy-acid oxidase GLO5 n=1 Tax=Smittium mucronatum TaxID=133383 RepID=A0A1R0H4B0_9FUNG|nr:Peroxisomal (S)-2-hydroxy-acid oxidase GLO5 [Smittium mucronatum]
MSRVSCIADIEKIALDKLPRNARNYYTSGSQDMITLHENQDSFDRIQIRPRVLMDVEKVDMTVKVLGETAASPIFVAASALQKMADPIGEIGGIRGAVRHGVVHSLSSISTASIEEVGDAAKALVGTDPSFRDMRWFQLYIYKDRSKTLNLIQRATKSGCKAIIVTVDTPYLGRRLPDIREPFEMPAHLSLANFKTGEEKLTDDENTDSENASWLAKYFTEEIDASLTWDDVAWVKSQTTLPVLVKGVLSAEDAVLAVQNGCSGIIVSNHGGRQLDSAPSTIDALYPIAKAVNKRIPIYLDGGIRRGTDVFKAIALGADAIFVGRPVLWALAYDGENGVNVMLDILVEEFRMAMALAGCRSIKDINIDRVMKSSKYTPKL